MGARKLELARRYDETARLYDRRYEEIQRVKYDFISPELPSPRKILDLGCGTGIFLCLLSRRGAFAVGVDTSREMLEIAKQRCSAPLVLADADHLPFGRGCFDAVVSVTLLQNMPDPAMTVKEIARVVKTGGIVALTVLKHKHPQEELEGWVRGAGLKPINSGEIPSSEDVFCVAVR